MTAKLDGTNGLLQQYDYQAPTTGFSYTFAAGTTVLVMNPAGTLATGTITMPASPADGMTITFSSTQTITALTVNANTGQNIVSAPTVLPARQAGAYVYRLSNTTWYPYESVPTNVPTTPAGGSIITSGTAVASTSGTSIDFTSIPSWVKRITVMLAGVSTSGTSGMVLRAGTSGGIDSTNYASNRGTINNTGVFVVTTTTSVDFASPASAAVLQKGNITLVNISGNTWVVNSAVSDTGTQISTTTAVISLTGVLDRVRITTTNGTDTFDAGTINILYE